MELIHLSLHELRDKLRSGELTSVELTEAFLARIEETDERINAFITLCKEEALAQAAEADKRRAAGEDLPLLGVPIALKDIFVTEGVKSTCGSKILSNYIPPYDGTAVRKLKEAGAVLLGKLSMDEFAMGSSNETSAFGDVRNPWNLDYVPGGSSGGSAACMAASQAAATSPRPTAAWWG